jgi:hypothetical protein
MTPVSRPIGSPSPAIFSAARRQTFHLRYYCFRFAAAADFLFSSRFLFISPLRFSAGFENYFRRHAADDIPEFSIEYFRQLLRHLIDCSDGQ